MALTDDGDEAVAEADAERKRQYSKRARELVEGIETPVEPTELAVA